MNETATGASEKRLTQLEYERLEKLRLLQEFRGKENQILALRERSIADRKAVLEMSIKNLGLERLEIERECQKVTAALANDKQEHTTLLEDIRSRLGIEGKFGYNPDTLEIVQDE